MGQILVFPFLAGGIAAVICHMMNANVTAGFVLGYIFAMLLFAALYFIRRRKLENGEIHDRKVEENTAEALKIREEIKMKEALRQMHAAEQSGQK